MSNFTRIVKTQVKLWNFICKMTFCEIWHFFSRTSIRNFLWCYCRWLITSLALENVKKKAICFKLFWYKVLIHWKLKLLNFPMDSILTHYLLLTCTIFCSRRKTALAGQCKQLDRIGVQLQNEYLTIYVIRNKHLDFKSPITRSRDHTTWNFRILCTQEISAVQESIGVGGWGENDGSEKRKR